MANEKAQPWPDLYARTLALVELHEGYSTFPRPDVRGTVRIGFGTNLSLRGISRNEASILALNDIHAAADELQKFPWWDEIGTIRQCALLDMAYCLGIEGLKRFKLTLLCLALGSYNSAANGVLDSDFARELPARAAEDAAMIRSGEFGPGGPND